MQAFQSEEFRRMSPEAKRAALKSAIAAQDPDSGFSRNFEYAGKRYRTLPLHQLEVEHDDKSGPAEA